MEVMFGFGILVFWVATCFLLPAFVADKISVSRGYDAHWWLVGLFAGWLGVLVLAVALKDNTVQADFEMDVPVAKLRFQCPHCKVKMKGAAKAANRMVKCPGCDIQFKAIPRGAALGG